jgi:nucleoside-diphosphate-sugar epimerase
LPSVLMRVFVAGATGALGSRLIPLLLADGHSVVGSTHTAANLAAIRNAGGEAAAAARTQRFLAQSFCGWPYARSGDPVKAEDAPLDPTPPRELRRTLEAIRYLEARVLRSPTIAGLVLRYGAFYGPGTGMLDEKIVAQLRHRRFPLLGGGTGWWSLVHIDDAAAATAIAVERGEPGVYNIVDDNPAQVADWLPALAAATGGKPPHRIPKWLARPLAGAHLVTMMTETRAGSNAKAKRILGWKPHHPSWRTGFGVAMADAGAPAR